jgi:hypothetical protein
MRLQEALDKFKEGVISQLSPDDVAIMEKAHEELVRSGITGKVKKIGDQAPAFTLPNVDGELVNLSRLLARGPVVVTFYRGVW